MLEIVVLLSGGGSNFQSLADTVQKASYNAKIVKVIADRPAKGLERAEKMGIETALVDRKVHKESLSSMVQAEIPESCDLIVLAGYLSILSPEFVESYPRRIINIHPSLLPAYGGKGMHGMNVHRAIIAAGETESGCTLHYVDQGVDTGEVILQRKVPVLSGDSPEDLQKRVLVEEHKLLPQGVAKIIEEKLLGVE